MDGWKKKEKPTGFDPALSQESHIYDLKEEYAHELSNGLIEKPKSEVSPCLNLSLPQAGKI